MKKIICFCKDEVVLTAAIVLAIFSAIPVPPDAAYLNYIDFRTLSILFSLMAVMAGLRSQGVFDSIGHGLLRHTHSIFQVISVLVLLCFFSSMLITNDVALLTFVPFSFVVLHLMGTQREKRWITPVVCMQTIAANLGSMLTPIGNPQNLYLYGRGNFTLWGFLKLMLPYTLLSLVMLIVWAWLLCRSRAENISVDVGLSSNSTQSNHSKRALIAMYSGLFVLCLLTVMRAVSYLVVLIAVVCAVLIFDRTTLKKVDFSLIGTFIAFFIFIGNIGRLPAFSSWLQGIIAGREVLVSVAASQITSNVPAALLLSGFSDNVPALVIGCNLGGLGTLIASMASLISYRQLTRFQPDSKKAYFRLFTVSNLVFLAALLLLWVLI